MVPEKNFVWFYLGISEHIPSDSKCGLQGVGDQDRSVTSSSCSSSSNLCSWIRGLFSLPLLILIGIFTQFSQFFALFFLSPSTPWGWRNFRCFLTNLWYVLWCFPTIHLHFIIINIHATSKLNDWILLWKQTLNIVILMTFGYFHFISKKKLFSS